MIDFTPQAIAFQIGPLPVYWYGIAYAVGLAAAYWLLVRQAKVFGQDPDHVGNGLIIVAIAALIGGRAYHVIDQWQLYKDDLPKIFLPPYSGLGVYGGIFTGTLAVIAYTRWKRLPFWTWADIIAPALFLMQGIGRWGNFFNQELYGPPTTLPWGIAIDCAHRVAAYPCTTFPPGTHFTPLFLYESLSGFAGAAVLVWLSMHRRERFRPGDFLLIFLVWYAIVRFVLEYLRTGNWIIGGIPTAQIMSIITVIVATLTFFWRHRSTGGGEGRPAEAMIDDPFADDSFDEVPPDRTADTADRPADRAAETTDAAPTT